MFLWRNMDNYPCYPFLSGALGKIPIYACCSSMYLSAAVPSTLPYCRISVSMEVPGQNLENNIYPEL